MATKIVKVVEVVPPGASGSSIRDQISMALGSAQRAVRREKGLIVPPVHATYVKILIEQEYDDGQ